MRILLPSLFALLGAAACRAAPPGAPLSAEAPRAWRLVDWRGGLALEPDDPGARVLVELRFSRPEAATQLFSGHWRSWKWARDIHDARIGFNGPGLSYPLFGNQLTNVSLAKDMKKLNVLGLSLNQLRSLDLPSGISALAFLNLNGNQLTNLTLPPDMEQLIGLFVSGNPLDTLVLSEPQAATNLASTVAALRNQGVSVFAYPLAIRLTPWSPQPVGAFRFTITGPPGDYTILSSTNLADWSELGVSSIPLGSNTITDLTAQFSPQKFYRARALR